MSSGRLAFAITDEELADRYQATGDPEYFAQIFARHRTRVFCACRRFFGSATLAEDATQETFLRAYQAIHGFQRENLCGWLMRISRNVCIDLWRKRRPEVQEDEANSLERPTPFDLEHLTAVNRAMEQVHEGMKLLSPEQRRCIEMKMDGYSYEETSERTGLPIGAVKSHLQNGRRMLWTRVQGIVSELP